MRLFFASWLIVGMTVLSGCGGAGTPGGPGVDPNGKGKGNGEETFKIDVPFLSTKVTQGTRRSL